MKIQTYGGLVKRARERNSDVDDVILAIAKLRDVQRRKHINLAQMINQMEVILKQKLRDMRTGKESLQ